MFLKISRVFLAVVFSLVLASCATRGGDLRASNTIKQNGTWFLLTVNTLGDKSYYDPHKTFRDNDGNVQTLVWVAKAAGGSTGVDQIKINCSQKIYQAYRVTPSGGYELYQDWSEKQADGTVGALWIKNLCNIRNNDGDLVEFINISPNNNEPGKYFGVWWLPEKSFEPATKNGKAYKIVWTDYSLNKWHHTFFYADCDSRRYATAADQSKKNLKWEAAPPNDSTYGFLLTKACGFGASPKPVAGSSPNSSANRGGVVSLDDAKDKCASLGFKKGSETFGNCVLKLTR